MIRLRIDTPYYLSRKYEKGLLKRNSIPYSISLQDLTISGLRKATNIRLPFELAIDITSTKSCPLDLLMPPRRSKV
jgi:hypothetical protein